MESLFEALVFGVLPALPGIGLSLLALFRLERALVWQVLGLLACAAGIGVEEFVGFVYSDTAAGHACARYGGSTYCEVGVTFPVLALALLGFGVLNLLGIPIGLILGARLRQTRPGR